MAHNVPAVNEGFLRPIRKMRSILRAQKLWRRENRYLVADGFWIKTPLFTIKMKIPGEYTGLEPSLPEDVFPQARIQVSAEFKKYLQERVEVKLDGMDQRDGMIAEATDEATGLMDDVATIGNILTVRGYGLKLKGSPDNQFTAGVFFKPPTGVPIEVPIIPVNEPKTLKLLVPPSLTVGTKYQIVVQTWSSARDNGGILKRMRDLRSEFTVTAA